jgi:hypothetical protein
VVAKTAAMTAKAAAKIAETTARAPVMMAMAVAVTTKDLPHQNPRCYSFLSLRGS